jgi:hypothetical protein
MMHRGQWGRWGRRGSSCVGYSLEIGNAFRCSVVPRGIGHGQARRWDASINQAELGSYPECEIAMARIEERLEGDMKSVLDDWGIYRALKLMKPRS